jgi:hypothetical protein
MHSTQQQNAKTQEYATGKMARKCDVTVLILKKTMLLSELIMLLAFSMSASFC